MISFESDYNNGAHEEVLAALVNTNAAKTPGYGTDEFCESAKARIRAACGREDAEIEFLVGGTQTNSIIIATMLHDHEGVVAADTGHVNCHEAGAIEYSGHKVLSLPAQDGEALEALSPTAQQEVREHQISMQHVPPTGKLNAADVDRFITDFYKDDNHEHMVYPGMVYISHPTEYGTLYTRAELTALHEVCSKWNIPLFLDGARLAYALASRETDVTLKDIAQLTDVFYIGGTKCGALCGEAVVFTGGSRPQHFVNAIKKRGALLAKGRLLGVQFDALFTEDLYGRIGRHAIDLAEELKDIIREKELPFFLDSPTNQQFIVVDNAQLEELAKHVRYGFWEKYDDTHTVIRLATSWATTKEDLEALRKVL